MQPPNMYLIKYADSPPLLMMGDLIRYFESQSRTLDKMDHMITGPLYGDHSFVSTIKFGGVPILPPVMTNKRRDEMMSYKRQAQFIEKRLQSRQRSRLMARAQNIVQDTQPTEETDLDTLSSNFSQADRVASILREEGLQPGGHESQDTNTVHTLTNSALTYAIMDHQQTQGNEPGLQTLDSLSSDLASLEDLSLPTDFSGMPLTSLKQQQISQNLARLSRGLNIRESQSLNSTGSSEISEIGQAALKLSLGSPQYTAAKFYNPNNYSVNNSESSSVFHDSQDTIVEVSHDLTVNSTSGFVSNANSDIHTDGSGPSPNDSSSTANTSHSSANCSTSTVDSQKSNKSSPRSLKNTVHFAHFVTEITRQSVEDNITLRKLEDTPTNSPRDTLPMHMKSAEELSESQPCLNEAPSSKGISMLSRVEFSPEGDSTPSPLEHEAVVPFQGYSGDNDISTSDKENEQRPVSLRGPVHSTSLSTTESSTSVRFSERGDSSQTTASDLPSSHHYASCVSESVQSSDHLLTQASCVEDSVSASQASARSNLTVGTSESGSSTLRSDNILSSKDSSCFSGPVPVNTASTDIEQFIRNINNGAEPQNSTSNNSGGPKDAGLSGVKPENEMGSKEDKPVRKGHVRRGSYTLSEPSPVLLRSHGLTAKERQNQQNKPLNAPVDTSPKSINNPTQRKLQYHDVDQIEPTSIPMPPGPEAEAKAAHIKKYLSQVQSQNLSEGLASPSVNVQPPEHVGAKNRQSQVVDSISIIQSLIESIESTPDADAGSLLNLHASKMEMLRQQMIAQQRQELEELFVQQRREQLLLQEEVEAHQRRLREQQDFLADNAPENMKKGKILNLDSEALEQTETKIQNVPGQTSKSMSNLSMNTHNQSIFKRGSVSSPKVRRPVLRSPMKVPAFYQRSGPVVIPDEVHDPRMKQKFERVSAVAKGFLTRRLMQSEKVQELLLTIKDTQAFAQSFQSETPIKRGNVSHQDRDLMDRISAQVQAALLDLHEIIFDIPVAERMSLIAHTRQLQEEKRLKASGGSLRGSQPKISAATLRAIERKRKAQEAEAAVFGSNTARPRTAPPSTSSPRAHATDLRALRPLQGQVSPIRAEENSPRNEKERPKTAPEKSESSKSRKLSIPSKPTSISTGRQAKPHSTVKPKVTATKPKKPEKAWR